MDARYLSIFGLIFCCTISLSSALNISVTSSNCTGAGSITAAIISANINPGLDTIIFQENLVVDVNGDACGFDFFSRPVPWNEYYVGLVNESVAFIGNNALLSGCHVWANNQGQINPIGSGYCPQTNNLYNSCGAPGFIRVGVPGLDNSGINVEIKGLRANDLEQLVQLEKGASLNIDQGKFEGIYPQLTCTTSPIYGEGNNVINVTRSSFKNCWLWTSFRNTIYASGGVINSNGPRLYVYNTSFDLCKTQFTIAFTGESPTDVANIVNCIFDGLSEGVTAFKGTMNIVNSLMNFYYPLYGGDIFYRVFAAPFATINLIASTVVVNTAQVSKGTCAHHTFTK